MKHLAATSTLSEAVDGIADDEVFNAEANESDFCISYCALGRS
jgi:hypothetical protein